MPYPEAPGFLLPADAVFGNDLALGAQHVEGVVVVADVKALALVAFGNGVTGIFKEDEAISVHFPLGVGEIGKLFAGWFLHKGFFVVVKKVACVVLGGVSLLVFFLHQVGDKVLHVVKTVEAADIGIFQGFFNDFDGVFHVAF